MNTHNGLGPGREELGAPWRTVNLILKIWSGQCCNVDLVEIQTRRGRSDMKVIIEDIQIEACSSALAHKESS